MSVFSDSTNSSASATSRCHSRICLSQTILLLERIVAVAALLVAASAPPPRTPPDGASRASVSVSPPDARPRLSPSCVWTGTGCPSGSLCSRRTRPAPDASCEWTIAQRRVAVRHRIHQHAQREKIVDVVNRLVLQSVLGDLVVDGVEVLGPAEHLSLNPSARQVAFQESSERCRCTLPARRASS